MDLNGGLWQGSLEDPVQLECWSGCGAESELREASLFGVGSLTTEVVETLASAARAADLWRIANRLSRMVKNSMQMYVSQHTP